MLQIDNTTYFSLTHTVPLPWGPSHLEHYSESSVVVAKKHLITYKSIKSDDLRREYLH
jgi:hypothetical protein